ncbi:hypothetical protein IFM89_019671 [Coptis chinensis]|uniref:Uncharacterized protein n=1 Tax=Coptis chinensis TaxID=261450 RepID=A0A835M444_9MAGN|nr:hypothetical protein IFM89_019671 [Coptis chinensis]
MFQRYHGINWLPFVGDVRLLSPKKSNGNGSNQVLNWIKLENQSYSEVLLDEEEFEKASATFDYDESYMNPAEELGLMGNEMANNSKPSKVAWHSEKGYTLEELPPSLMGKLLVYKSAWHDYTEAWRPPLRRWPFIGEKVGSFVDRCGNHIEMGLHVIFGC